jgi:hypothetical protein
MVVLPQALGGGLNHMAHGVQCGNPDHPHPHHHHASARKLFDAPTVPMVTVWTTAP